MNVTEEAKQARIKSTEPKRIKIAIEFFKKNKGLLVDACLNFGVPFIAVYREMEAERIESNYFKRPDAKIKKKSLRDHALEYMRENPEVSAYQAAKLVGLKTDASVNNFLRKEFKKAGKHLIKCGTCGRLPQLKSTGRRVSKESKIAQAEAWKHENNASDYEACNHFGILHRSALSQYRKRMAMRANRCAECGQPFDGEGNNG